MRLLVVEDEPDLLRVLVADLEEEGYAVDAAADGEEGLFKALSWDYDAIVLDVMLPRQDGWQVLRKVREAKPTPVLMLTARDATADRVRGLDSGADDYLVKPFAFPELLARLEAVHRRTTDRPAAIVKAGPLTLDLTTRRVTRDGQDVEVTPTEFSILEMLIRYAGQVVTRKMLCEHVWEADWEGLTNVVEVHIKRLRDKLAAAGEPDLIRTVRGRGYAVRAL
jgi:two-component system, OmpR family, response regulator